MDIAPTQTTAFDSMNLPAENAGYDETVPSLPVPDISELASELGLWLSGLESFLNVRNHLMVEDKTGKAAARDWTKQFRLTRSTLLFCSRLTFQFGKILKNRTQNEDSDFEINSLPANFDFSADEIQFLSQALKDSVLLNDALLRAAPLKFGEWSAWCNFLAEKFKTVSAFGKLIELSEHTGENYLPQALRDLLIEKPLSLTIQADLQLVLPRFGKILKSLSVIDRMLKDDEPLKPSLLIFSRLQEQIQELTNYLNNRLLRFPDDTNDFFGLLDGAAYTASIELRKVYNHELTGIAEIRQTPSIYAKIETAYSLLNDSFQQTLVNFAQLIDPEIEPKELFPNFDTKLRQSVILRQCLWDVLKTVQQTEHNPEEEQIESLNQQLTEFLNKSLHFLFYKDMETVERFIEEVLVTADKKDLVPILHRFGAYLETLFGQVNMRAVLASRPFNYSEGQ